MKVYKYKYSYYLISQLIPAILIIGVFVWSIYQRIYFPENILYRLLIVVMPVVIISTFITLNTPHKVIIDGDNIHFFSFGMKHSYDLSKIKKINVNEFIFSDKYLVRLGEPSVLRGRYWISNNILGHDELLAFFKEKEKYFNTKKQYDSKKTKKRK
ncbi:MAG: hypothetical protein PWQ97_926 [Tepidanaerobacteraceae bacterium]|nr:hypothetical protein [Tepidanaerobacteraceae bacterium]